jgi:hypothetical protein
MAKANCQNRYVATIMALELSESHYSPTQVQIIHKVKQKPFEGNDKECCCCLMADLGFIPLVFWHPNTVL